MTTVAEAIARFIANEARVDEFVNEEGEYVDSDSDTVETLASFIERKDDEISQRYVLNMKGDWLTATDYIVNDLVIQTSVVYMCVEIHTSGTFSTDLAAGKWITYQGQMPYELHVDTEAAVIAAIGNAGIKVIKPTVDYQLKADLTVTSGKIYAPLPGIVVSTNYSIRSADYRWVLTGSGTAEYRCELAAGTDPGFSKPTELWIGGSAAVEGTAGSLASGEWDYSGGYIIVRMTDDADPDTHSLGYIEPHYTLTFASGSQIQDNGGQIFEASSGEVIGIPGPTNPIWWGADSTGAVDATTYIETALAASASEKKTSIINGGTFLISDLDMPSNSRLEGTGILKMDTGATVGINLNAVSDLEIAGSLKLQLTAASQTALKIEAAAQRIDITGLEITSSDEATIHASSIGVDIANSYNVTFYGLKTHHIANHVKLQAAANRITFYGCALRGTDSANQSYLLWQSGAGYGNAFIGGDIETTTGATNPFTLVKVDGGNLVIEGGWMEGGPKLAANYDADGYGIEQTSGTLTVKDTQFNAVFTGLAHSGKTMFQGVIFNDSVSYGATVTTDGDTTNGSAIIGGMASTTGYNIGDQITVSAGFAATGPYAIVNKGTTSLTLELNATSNQSNITVTNATTNPYIRFTADSTGELILGPKNQSASGVIYRATQYYTASTKTWATRAQAREHILDSDYVYHPGAAVNARLGILGNYTYAGVRPVSNYDLPYSTWHVLGSLGLQYGGHKTSAFSADVNATWYTVGVSSANITCSLPAVAGAVERVYAFTLLKGGNYSLILDPDGAELINGASTYTLTNSYESAIAINNGTGWYIIATAQDPIVVTKTDTGDPTVVYKEGAICINTFDNTVKVYGDAGWREIASGW